MMNAPAPEQVSKQFTTHTVLKAAEDGGFSFVISSPAIDRDNDTITAKALKKVAATTKEVICLWQHKADQPIGRWHNLRMQGEKLIADLHIAQTNLGKMVSQLLAEDIPLAASVGFAGKGTYDEKRNGIDWVDIELFETSVVSVPANPQAQRIAKSFGFSPDDLVEADDVADVDPVRLDTSDLQAAQKRAAAALAASLEAIHK